MHAIESTILDHLATRKNVLFLGLVTLLAIAVRLSGLGHISGDASVFLLPWYDQIDHIRLSALSEQVGNYNITYQALILLGTFLPIEPLLWYKGLSTAFDFALAIEGYLLLRSLGGSRTSATLAYALLILLPPIWMNSSVWAQCDSIYAAFALMALRRLIEQKFIASFLLLGVAFAFKLQSCFIMPFFFFYYLQQRKFSISYFLLPLVSFYALCIPGLLAGRSLLDPLRIYFGQAGTYPSMSKGYPSFWTLIGDDYATLGAAAIALAAAIVLAGFFVLLPSKKNSPPRPNEQLLLIAAWMTWTCVQFLPAMHERYGYLVAVLLTLVMLLYRKPSLAVIWVVDIGCDCITYGNYLFHLDVALMPCAIVLLGAWTYLTFIVFQEGSPAAPASALGKASTNAEPLN